LRRIELLIVGFTIGAPGSGIFLQLLCLVQRDLDVDLAALSLISLIGLVATRNLWLPRRHDFQEIAIWIAVVLPLATMTWWWSFGAFSNFPFADIGADVHWMKIAQEFADTGILNPYAGQTYLDARAATAGLLSGTLGLDLLQFHWAYRYISILLLGMIFYAAANSLFPDVNRKWFAVFFAVSTNMLGVLTNGSLAVASSFLFLIVLLRIAPAPPTGRPFLLTAIVPVATALIAGVVAFLVNNNTLLLAVLFAFLLILNGAGRLRADASRIAASLIVTLAWPMSLIFVHRSAYLFVPIAVASWLFYLVILKVASRPHPRLLKSLWAAGLMLPLLCVLILLWVAAARAGVVPKVSANGPFSYLTKLVLGTGLNQGDEITLGAGPEVAAIELGRAIGPAFAILVGALYLWWSVRTPPARLIQLIAVPDQSAAIVRLFWSWLAAFILSLAVLSGFPFMYRMLFIALGMFVIATTEVFGQLFLESGRMPVDRLRRVSCFALALIATLTIGVYAFSWWPDLPYSIYQAMLRPGQLAALTVVAVCTGLAFSGRRRVQIMAAMVVFSLSIAIDRAAIVNLFRVYSYGRPPVGATFISHYDASDLSADRWLHKNLPKSIALSDPVTLAMARAVAGSPSLYLFSNLDTVNPLIAEKVREAISAIVQPEQNASEAVTRACAVIVPMLLDLNSEARAQIGLETLAQGLFKPVRAGAQQSTLSVAPKDQAIVIINPRTMQWLRLGSGRSSYFPIDQPLDPELLHRLGQGAFPLLFSDGQNAIVSIDCS
jgi:hypothetical protein